MLWDSSPPRATRARSSTRTSGRSRPSESVQRTQHNSGAAERDQPSPAHLRVAELAAGAHEVAALGAAACGVGAGVGEPPEELADSRFFGGGPGAVAAGV